MNKIREKAVTRNSRFKGEKKGSGRFFRMSKIPARNSTKRERKPFPEKRKISKGGASGGGC